MIRPPMAEVVVENLVEGDLFYLTLDHNDYCYKLLDLSYDHKAVDSVVLTYVRHLQHGAGGFNVVHFNPTDTVWRVNK